MAKKIESLKFSLLGRGHVPNSSCEFGTCPRIYLMILICGILLFLTGPALAQDGPVARIISLGPVLTEEIFLLGGQDRLVGVTTYCQRPAAATLKERVGSIQDINIEKVVALKPDLVLATVLTDPRAKAKLRSLGIRVVDVPNAVDFNGVCDVFRMVAGFLGKDKEAEAIIVDSRQKVAALRSKAAAAARVRVFVEVGVNPLVTIGQGAFVNDLITLAGGDNIVREHGYLQYSREIVLKRDPDVILISSMGFDGAREKTNWERFGSLKAVAGGRINILDEYLLCSPTPVSFVQTLVVIMGFLHPEIR